MAKPTVFLIDGIWSNGEQSVDKFKPFLEEAGFEVVDITLPYDSAFTAQFEKMQRRRARVILDHPKYRRGQCYVVSHSNGSQLTNWAGIMGAEFKAVFMYNAALPADVHFPVNLAEVIYNIYSPHDRALWLGSVLPGFGQLGRVGYKGWPDHRVINIANDTKCQTYWTNHGCAFKEPYLTQQARFLVATIEAIEQCD